MLEKTLLAIDNPHKDFRLRLTTEMLAPDGSARWRRSGEIGDAAAADAMDRARALGLQLGTAVHAMAGDQQVQP